MGSPATHLWLYEPRVEGHHLTWLRFLTEDLLAGGFRISLGLDWRTETESRIKEHMAGLLDRVRVFSVQPLNQQRSTRGKLANLANGLMASGAGQAFLCEFDEIASGLLRRSALGMLPPAVLRGKLSGIYYRPRFLLERNGMRRHFLKRTGFRRLARRGWLGPLLFNDERLVKAAEAEHPSNAFFYLPEPCPEGFNLDGAEARLALGLPPDRCIFLFYGGGYRRKGLHLAVQAMLGLPATEPVYLLCVGQHQPSPETARGLDELVAQGRAMVQARYVSSAEEKQVFAASDWVLLPYIHHFGGSGVLSCAMAARRPVIASDEFLLGDLVRRNATGMLFPSQDVSALREELRRAAGMPPDERQHFVDAADRYARKNGRDMFRARLLAAMRPRQALDAAP